jgi:hypothetical protein
MLILPFAKGSRRGEPSRAKGALALALALAFLMLGGVAAASTGHTAEPAHGADAAHAAGAVTHDANPVGLLPLWSAVPFVCILLSIALFPLLAPHFWHHHFPKVSAFWALLFAVPFLVWNPAEGSREIIHIVLIDYVPFIILLWGLYTIAGGIYIGGNLRGKPAVNVLLLLIGTFLASLIGTTGAAMVHDPPAAARQRLASLAGARGDLLHLPDRQHRRLADAAGRPAAVPRLPARRAVLLGHEGPACRTR